MAGDLKTTGTMSNINCRDTLSIESSDNHRPSIVKLEGASELSQAFSDFSKQLQNLNALILNGVPLMINVPPAENHITVEPPSVRVEAPMVRVENHVPETPAAKIFNCIHVSTRLTKKETRGLAYCLLMLFSLQFVAIAGIFWVLSQ